MSEGTIRMFPILWPYRRSEIAALDALSCPRQVPWDLVFAHQGQCLTNHEQTVQRLAERGGLSPSELVAILEDRPWRRMTDEEAAGRLRALACEVTPDTFSTVHDGEGAHVSLTFIVEAAEIERDEARAAERTRP